MLALNVADFDGAPDDNDVVVAVIAVADGVAAVIMAAVDDVAVVVVDVALDAEIAAVAVLWDGLELRGHLLMVDSW